MSFNYSIIVPYHDKYELFLKAVESVPDREDIQIVVVDNAPKYLLARQVPKKQHATILYVISSPTKGAGSARNEGLKHVEGKYILFLDADDYFTEKAFEAFDRYLDKDYDIVFFKPTSIRLSDGELSSRHHRYEQKVDDYLQNNNENGIRYRWEVPWAKLFRSDFVVSNNFKFDELRVNNDAWFSLMTGHHAKRIKACTDIVYVVTEAGRDQSLTKTMNRDNLFTRYCVAIRSNKFLKAVNHYDMRIRLLGFLNTAYREFGIKEFFRYLNVAWKNKVSIF